MTSPENFTAADLADPNVDPSVLAQVAAVRPDLQREIYSHPNSYEGLREWIAQQPGFSQQAADQSASGPAAGQAQPMSQPSAASAPSGGASAYSAPDPAAFSAPNAAASAPASAPVDAGAPAAYASQQPAQGYPASQGYHQGAGYPAPTAPQAKKPLFQGLSTSAHPGVPAWLLYAPTVIAFGALLAFIGVFLRHLSISAEGETLKIGLMSISGTEDLGSDSDLAPLEKMKLVWVGVLSIIMVILAVGSSAVSLFMPMRWIKAVTAGIGGVVGLFVLCVGVGLAAVGTVVKKTFSLIPYVGSYVQISTGGLQPLFIIGGLLMIAGAAAVLVTWAFSRPAKQAAAAAAPVQ